LIVSNDLSIKFGVSGQFGSEEIRFALAKIIQSCKAHEKMLRLTDIYDEPDFQDWAVNELSVCFLLAGQASEFLAKRVK